MMMDTVSYEESREQVYSHLLFHKSLIDENDDNGHLDECMALVKGMGHKDDPIVGGSFENALMDIFKLTIEEGFDPWNIDLAKFSKMYMARVKKEDDVNFITAGRLVFMAWSILKLQSDEVLEEAEVPDEEETFFSDWDMSDYSLYDTTEDFDYTHLVLDGDEPPLEEKIRRKVQRPVTLMELVDAFDEARREAELQLEINAIKDANRKKCAELIDIHEKVHSENLQADIGEIWERICDIKGDKVRFMDVCRDDTGDVVTAFIAVLFLARDGKISIRQRNFPYGEIIIQNAVPVKERLVREAMEAKPLVELVEQSEAHEEAHKEIVNSLAVV